AFLDDTSATPIALMISTDGCLDLTPYKLLHYPYCEHGHSMRYVFASASNPFKLRIDANRYELYRGCASHSLSQIIEAKTGCNVVSL
ncbi:hypothetical protein AAVH_21452, partial [Aphelenchoides avenae]